MTGPTVGQSIHHIAHLLPNLNMCVCTYAKLNWPCLGKYLLFFYDKYAWIILLRPYCIVCLLGASIIHNTICNPFFKNIVYDQNQIIHRTHMHLPSRDLVGKRLNSLIRAQFALLFWSVKNVIFRWTQIHITYLAGTYL